VIDNHANNHADREEARQLADAMVDRRMNPQMMQRLDELITSDLGCLQAYVERIDFHGELIEQSVECHSANRAVVAMDQIAQSTTRYERRQNWKLIAGTVVCLSLVVGVLSWLVMTERLLPSSVGTIAALTSDLQSHSTLELGQVVRKGHLFNLSSGVLTLQLPDVMVDVIGPAKIRIHNRQKMELLSGTIHAYVRPGGEGFAVHTKDSVIVDLGTEFAVTCRPNAETEVSVRHGRVQANLVGWSGAPMKELGITAGRAATFSQRRQSAVEVNYHPQTFEKIERTRGTIKLIDGMLRTAAQPPVSVASLKLPTHNHMLVIPEQQRVVLTEDLEVTGISGPVQIPAGTAVSSYLIHYDPDILLNKAPRGAVTFDGNILAVITTAEQLFSTDTRFGLPGLEYGNSNVRELELDEDEVRISDDRKTASFYFGLTGAEPIDHARVLVTSDAP